MKYQKIPRFQIHSAKFCSGASNVINLLKGGDLQQALNKIEKVVRSGSGTGELSFFFGMRHMGEK